MNRDPISEEEMGFYFIDTSKYFQAKEGSMSKYPKYSNSQMESINWRPNQMDLSPYLDMPWECAECSRQNLLSKNAVSLEGGKMRLIAKCKWCHKNSIIRIKGLFRLKLITEASISNSK